MSWNSWSEFAPEATFGVMGQKPKPKQTIVYVKPKYYSARRTRKLQIRLGKTISSAKTGFRFLTLKQRVERMEEKAKYLERKKAAQARLNEINKEKIVKAVERKESTIKGGGKMVLNFKSKASYGRWLAYGHKHKLFSKAPGHQKIKIKGRTIKVSHKARL